MLICGSLVNLAFNMEGFFYFVLFCFPRIQQQPSRRHLLRNLRTLQRYTHESGPGTKFKNSRFFALLGKHMFHLQKLGQKTPV